MLTLTPSERIALERAASGNLSGRVSEWPDLVSAFHRVGVEFDPDQLVTMPVQVFARAALRAAKGTTH